MTVHYFNGKLQLNSGYSLTIIHRKIKKKITKIQNTQQLTSMEKHMGKLSLHR